MSTSSHPTTWYPPAPQAQAHLSVYNSLTRSKVPFHTHTPGLVTWYNCGPTVYDAAHMGHARNYLTQDVIRRVLRDYFSYEVRFVMNVTDVDDKIIVRARQQHLLQSFLSTTPLNPESYSTVLTAFTTYTQKVLSPSLPASTAVPATAQELYDLVLQLEADPAYAKAQREREEKWGMYLTSVEQGLAALKAAEGKTGQAGGAEIQALVEGTKDAVGSWLDKEKGSSITDPTIFRSLAAFWETSFFNSMAQLNIERPTTLTRVSEYLPEIVAFVEKLVAEKKGYVDEGGSVWFDTGRFDGAEICPTGCEAHERHLTKEEGKHEYAKLQPWSKGNKALLEDGEGSLTTSSTKRSAADFCLWKTSKPGEPSWPSPWGKGRPGWHIECSVMATEILGERMDVHSGGVDLMFPHHDNELAQSEAYHSSPQWVAYFLHTGHLHIEGLKMSKSLKNFITIDDALQKYSARQLRLAFLGTTWGAKMDFKEGGMEAIKSQEQTFDNFFANALAVVREQEARQEESDGQHHFGQREQELFEKLYSSQIAFRSALSDSFDTPRALAVLLDLVSATNIYLAQGRSKINAGPVDAVAEWVTRMLVMFGLGEGPRKRRIGWGEREVQGQEGGADKETLLMPYLDALSGFRDQVRKLAREGASATEILKACDALRDGEKMMELGVMMDDQEDGKAKVKLVSVHLLRQARESAASAAAEKEARRSATLAAAEAKRLEKLEKGRLAPAEMFKTGPAAEEWTEWDEEGIPTKGKDGEEVSKGRKKKLLKEFEAQKRLHDEFLKAQSDK